MRLLKELEGHGGHWAVLGVFMLYTVSVYTALGERLDILDAIRHQLLLGLVLIALCVKVVLDDPPDLSENQSLLVVIALLFVVLLMHVPFAADPQYAKDTFIDYTLKEAMFTFFMVVLVRSPARLRVFMFTFLFSLFWLYQEAIQGLITGHLVWRNQGIQRLHGAVDLYRHPNGLSLIAVTGLPFLLYLFPVVRSKLLRLGMLGMSVLAGLCIVYTGSRSGYVGTIGVAFFAWAFSRHRLKKAVIGLTLAAVLVVSLPDQYKERFESIGGEEAEGHSKDRRLEIMRDAWQIFLQHPFGVGVNSFMRVRQQTFGRNQDTHNLYLQLLTHIGIHGTVVFLSFMGILFVSFNRAVARLKRLRTGLQRLTEVRDTDGRTGALLARTFRDAHYVEAVGQAGRLYLLMLTVNGIFAHTLYLICWWFAAGLAMTVSAMTGHMEEAMAEVTRRRAATTGDPRFSAGVTGESRF